MPLDSQLSYELEVLMSRTHRFRTYLVEAYPARILGNEALYANDAAAAARRITALLSDVPTVRTRVGRLHSQ